MTRDTHTEDPHAAHKPSRWDVFSDGSALGKGAWWLLGAYLVVSVVHVATLGSETAGWLTKPLLMPVLAAFLLVAAGSRGRGLPVAGVLACWAGDVALQFDGPLFIAGMACFAAGHACYIAAFRRLGARVKALPAALYAVYWAVLIVLLWSGLGGLAVPVALYSLLLVAMAVYAAALGAAAALGGALFVLSDTLIALRLADLPHADGLVMPTYLAAQALVVLTFVRRP